MQWQMLVQKNHTFNFKSFFSLVRQCEPEFILGNVGTETLTSATLTYQVDAVTQKSL